MSNDRPLPVPDPSTAAYWEGAHAHELRLPHCEDCGQVHFYPRTLCPHCGSKRLDWMRASGRGSVYSYTVVHRAPSPAFKDRLPYVVAIVALKEGPHLMSNIVGCAPADVRIGMPVAVAWEDIDAGITLPCFAPVSAASADR